MFQWKFSQNTTIFIEEIARENVVCEIASILSRPQCVKHHVSKLRQNNINITLKRCFDATIMLLMTDDFSLKNIDYFVLASVLWFLWMTEVGVVRQPYIVWALKRYLTMELNSVVPSGVLCYDFMGINHTGQWRATIIAYICYFPQRWCFVKIFHVIWFNL